MLFMDAEDQALLTYLYRSLLGLIGSTGRPAQAIAYAIGCLSQMALDTGMATEIASVHDKMATCLRKQEPIFMAVPKTPDGKRKYDA